MELHRWRHLRIAGGPDSTLSTLSDWNGDRICFTVEDQFQPYGQKVPGETRIPRGLYELEIRTDSPKFAHYWDRWDWFRGMPWLTDVEGDGEGFELEGFEWVYYHPGNDDDDSAGCPIVGLEYERTVDGDYRIRPGTSRPAFEKLCKLVYQIKLEDDHRIFVRVAGDESL